VEWGSD
jgi:hypothetical protein